MEKQNRYTSEFKTKVVLEVLREELTVKEIASKYEVSPVMVSRWKSEIMNSDQVSHFTNVEYLELLEKEGVKVSMDSKGRATDNSRTERYFRSLKYECIYLNEFENPRALRKRIASYVQFYN